MNVALGRAGDLKSLAGGAGEGSDGERAAVNSSSGSQGSFRVVLVTEDGWDDGFSMVPLLGKVGHPDLQMPLPLAFSSRWASFGGGEWLVEPTWPQRAPSCSPPPHPKLLGSPNPPPPCFPSLPALRLSVYTSLPV